MGGQTPCAALRNMLNKFKPYLSMVSLQFGYAGMYIISMVSLKHGMSNFILATYRHVAATIVIAPFAFLLERPVLDQNLYFLGMKYTSATYASAFLNIVPAVTFIMAMIFRLEKINVKKIRSVAKIIGTAITVMGAMVMTLYKGPIIDFVKSGGAIHHGTTAESADKHRVTGTIMLLGSVFCWSSFFILQSFTVKKYPAELSLTAWICFMGMLEGAGVSLVMVRDLSAWKIGWDSRLLAATYSGIVCSGITYYVQGVVIRERGPVFVSSFSPLCMIITAALGAIILAEKLHLGSILGAIIIVLGLYTVVWGKSKDGKNTETDDKSNGLQELPVKNNAKAISVDVGIDGSDKIVNIPTSKNPF
ncbi:hypothetical protein Goshw_020047 [Gossypium schwendimanii]|uniref:WAT1-related protein n=1 Tax=Gossypium schwendimanii TaxID=34291 RepID=A0A7J9KTI9_GOSSC|nr:hypothetical protein [Gossypium schwendimanii]